MKRLINAYKRVKEAVGANMLILGGDYANNGTKAYHTENYEGLKALLSGLSYFPVNGNHDDNSFWDAYIESDRAINHHTTQELYRLFYSHLPKSGAKTEGESSLYYFYDNKSAGVRYIFLDTNDIPVVYTETGALKYTKQHTFGISQAQTDWLINTALKTEKNTDIIIVAHNVLFPSSEKLSDENAPDTQEYRETKRIEFLNNILDAHNKKAHLSATYGEGLFEVCVNADFSEYSGNITGVFVGHYHKDIVEKSKTGIPFIYNNCTIMYNYSTPRIDGDKSEILFDVVTIDRKNKTIYTTRIGAGDDRKIKY